MRILILALLALPSLPMQSVEFAVRIGEKNYHPDNLDIRIGDQVTWTNFDADDHTVTTVFRSTIPDPQEGPFDSGRLASGSSFSHVFLREGTVRYYCKFHESTTGTVTVRGVR